jgi:hypothetical protein
MIVVKLADASSVESLMDAGAYEAFAESEAK